MYNPDGTQTFTATGHFGFIIFPTDVPAGPATIVYTGRIVYNVDPTTGVFTLVSESGTQRMSAPSWPNNLRIAAD